MDLKYRLFNARCILLREIKGTYSSDYYSNRNKKFPINYIF
jgi:hypothetical protein